MTNHTVVAMSFHLARSYCWGARVLVNWEVGKDSKEEGSKDEVESKESNRAK